MSANSIANKALEQGKGIVRLAPNWVPIRMTIMHWVVSAGELMSAGLHQLRRRTTAL